MGDGRERGSVCYANPALLLRRPISELLALQEGKRRLGLLIPAKGAEHERQLHHTRLFKKAEVLTYPAWHPPGAFEWPIPGPRFFNQGWKALKEYDTLHLWAHFYPSTLLLLLMSLFHRKTRIILTMDTLPGYSFSMGLVMDALFKIYTWTIGRIVYGIPDTITLYGEALLPHAKRSGINMKKVHVIPTGIMEHKVPSRRSARAKIEKELKLAKRSRIILYAGLINPRKRVADVLEVAKRVPEATFLIAGDGPSRKKLERRAKEESITNINFLGWRDDLLTLMRAADILLFPSSAEGLPGVVMEAMWCETPVITTRIPCTTDLIRNGKEGILCEVGDIDAMITALARIEKEGKRLATNAKQRIMIKYDWKRIVPSYERLYEAAA